MFIQVIQGRTSDAEGLRSAVDRWEKDVAPGAVGWLGSTGGVTEDGRAIAVVRFESEEAARRNSERPEQDQWWTETEKLFDGGVTFRDSSDVVVDRQGDPDRAGFVLGGTEIQHDGGAYTMVLYFTSEAEAREGERKEVPQGLRATMDEVNKLTVEEPEFFDLKQPEIRPAPPST